MDTIYEKRASITKNLENDCTTEKNIVLVGGPGSGKGTQAKQIAFNFGIPHIATGDLFRHHLKKNTKLGKLAQKYIAEGALVPDNITIAMLEKRLSKSDAFAGFILDGFPRTISQAETLTTITRKSGRPITTVLFIDVSDEEIVNRLSGRLICSSCQTPFHNTFHPPQKPGVCDRCGDSLFQRPDDCPEVVLARLKTYHDVTKPIVDYYKNSGLLVRIDGCGSVPEVTNRIIRTIAIG